MLAIRGRQPGHLLEKRMSEDNSIVILTGDGPEHKYVANAICSQFPVSAIFVLDGQARRPVRILQKGLFIFLDKVLWRAFQIATRDKKRRLTSLRSVLGSDLCSDFIEAGKVIRLGRASPAELAQAVQQFHPKVIAVYGTYKIPATVLNIADHIALNMHTGISPYYRGAACAFWPIVENNPERVGATVH